MQSQRHGHPRQCLCGWPPEYDLLVIISIGRMRLDVCVCVCVRVCVCGGGGGGRERETQYVEDGNLTYCVKVGSLVS